MRFANYIVLLAGIASAAATLPPPSKVVERAATCTPKAGGSSSIDDVPAIQSAIAACPSGTIVIPPSSTYYINSVFSFKGCAGCTLQVEGLLKVASNTDYWNGRAAIFDSKSRRIAETIPIPPLAGIRILQTTTPWDQGTILC